jgi:membrane protein implicated in regulation of membrane protease activity
MIEFFTWILLIIGALLILFEIILPAGISFSLGVSTLILSYLFHFHHVRDPFSLIIAWSLLSLGTASIGIWVSQMLFGGSKTKTKYDEDANAMGHIVEVRQNVSGDQGRIFYIGSTWEARTQDNSIIEAGDQAEICGRDNITYFVKSVQKDEYKSEVK